MEKVWNMYGIRMEYVWNTYGICMEYAWNMYGICMDYVWNMHGICCHLPKFLMRPCSHGGPFFEKGRGRLEGCSKTLPGGAPKSHKHNAFPKTCLFHERCTHLLFPSRSPPLVYLRPPIHGNPIHIPCKSHTYSMHGICMEY